MKLENHTWHLKSVTGAEITRTGYKLGPFGIYETITEGWAVTHLPSKLAVPEMGAPMLSTTVFNVKRVLDFGGVNWWQDYDVDIFDGLRIGGRSARETLQGIINGEIR